MVKRLLAFVSILFFLAGLTLWVSLNYLAPKYIRQTIQEKGSAALAGEIRLSELQIKWGLPLRITINQFSLSKKGKYLLEIPALSAALNLKDGLFHLNNLRPVIHINFENPQISLISAPSSDEKSSHPSEQSNEKSNEQLTLSSSTLKLISPRLQDLEVRLTLNNGQVKVTEKVTEKDTRLLDASNISFMINLPSLNEALALKFSGQLRLNHPMTAFFIPISISSQLKLDQGVLDLGATEISVLNINTKSKGNIDLKNRQVNIKVTANIPELEKLPLPTTENIPLKKWKGFLNINADIRGPLLNPNVNGSAQLKDAEFLVDFKNSHLNANGLLKANIDAQFVKDKPGFSFQFPSLKWNLDLLQMAITSPQFFHKEKNTPLNTQGVGSFSDDLQLEQFTLKLAQIELSASGRFSTSASSKFRVDIKPTTLVGLERMILPLAQYPMQGALALKSEIEGHLADPKKLKINLEMLKLEKVSTAVEFKNADLSLRGPVKLDLNGQLFVDQLQVRSGHVALFSDLTDLEVKFKDQFRKNPGEITKINMTATKTGETLALKHSQIQTPQGTLSLTGTPPLTLSAPMDLNLQIKSFDFGKLGVWLPKFAKMIPAGTLSSNLQIKGSLNSDDIMKSPLTIYGKFSADLPKYLLVSEKKTSGAKETPPEPKPAPAFVQDSPLIRQLMLEGTLTLGQFEMDKFSARGISAQLKLANSNLNGSAQIKNIFDGAIQLNQVTVPLTKPDPEIQFDLKTQNIRLEQVTKAFVPDYEKLTTGMASLSASGHTKMPGTPAFLEKIEAAGTFNLNQCVLNTVHLSEILKDIIQKIPGAKPDMLTSRGPMQVEVKSNFKLKNGQIEIKPFDAVTIRKEQLLVSGKANLKMDLDLKGSLFLVDQFVGGSFFEANKDSLGRLEIPLIIQGNAMKPEFKFAQDTISTMLGKTIEFEKNKIIKKAQAEAQKEIQKQMDQAKAQAQKELEKKRAEAQDRITEELKKKAQQLFK